MSKEKENEYFTLDDGDKPNKCNVSFGMYRENIIYKIVYLTKIPFGERKEYLKWEKRYFCYDDRDDIDDLDDSDDLDELNDVGDVDTVLRIFG